MSLLTSFCIFFYFWIVGFAILTFFFRSNDLIAKVLVSPAAGILTVALCNYLLSRSGFCISVVALPISISLLILSIGIFFRFRPAFPLKAALPFLLMLATAFVAAGWPLLKLGFSWLGSLNPDCAIDILDAARLSHSPYIGKQDPVSWMNQTDWTSYFVFMPLLGIRTGPDLLLAWVAKLAGHDEAAMLMPLIVALHTAAIASACALIGKARRLARLLAGFLLALSAMSTLGSTMNLLGQEVGITALTFCCILFLRPFYRLGTKDLCKYVIFAGLSLAGFIVCYQEMLPFLGLAFLLYHSLHLTELGTYWRRVLGASLGIGIICCILIAADLIPLMNLLMYQATTSFSAQRLFQELFPYFLIPSGFAVLWGLRPFTPGSSGLLGDQLSIVLGFLLSCIALVSTAWLVYRRQTSAVVLTVMLVLLIKLILGQAGFGLFKLAMFMQPFLISTFVFALCWFFKANKLKWNRKSLIPAFLIFLLAIPNVFSQYKYVQDTTKINWQPMLERASEVRQLSSNTALMIALQGLSKSMLMGLYTKGHPSWNIDGRYPINVEMGLKQTDFAQLAANLHKAYRPVSFSLGANGPVHEFLCFTPPANVLKENCLLVLEAGDDAVINKSHNRPAKGLIYLAPLCQQQNTLVMINTNLGHIVNGTLDNVALWNFENDFLKSGSGLQGIGRHVLFEVLEPVPGSRLVFDFTNSGLAAQGISLPPAIAYGAKPLSFGLVGRGAARVLSDPILPREIGGHYYIALDMCADAAKFACKRQGLAGLYNTVLGDDPRRLTGFVRNISLLSPVQAKAMVPPSAVAKFPDDLLNPGLLFSGVYEDGWVAQAAWLSLSSPGETDILQFKANVPGFSRKISGGTLQILVDGTLVKKQKLSAGSLDLTLAIPERSGPRKIQVEISSSDLLPEPDCRLVCLHLEKLAILKKHS